MLGNISNRNSYVAEDVVNRRDASFAYVVRLCTPTGQEGEPERRHQFTKLASAFLHRRELIVVFCCHPVDVKVASHEKFIPRVRLHEIVEHILGSADI